MIKLKGKSASKGRVEGEVYFYRKEKTTLDKRPIYLEGEESEKLKGAIQTVKETLETERISAEKTLGKEEADLFLIHSMLLDDADFVGEMQSKIKEGFAAAYAADYASKALAERLSFSCDDYMKERAADLLEIGERLVFALIGKKRGIELSACGGVILCAEDLAPGETLQLDKQAIVGFALARGSCRSHTAILARSMGIPALVGVGDGLFSLAEGGRQVRRQPWRSRTTPR